MSWSSHDEPEERTEKPQSARLPGNSQDFDQYVTRSVLHDLVSQTLS